jgi:hypothetical protein
MSGRARLPEVPSSALRDVGTPERVERVWKRLEHDLAGTAPRSRGSFEWVWAPAAVVIIFVSGFFAGLGWHRGDPSPRPPSAEYEPIEPRTRPVGRAAAAGRAAQEAAPATSAARSAGNRARPPRPVVFASY